LPTANPLALGLAHAPSVLLAQRRRSLDLVDDAGLRGRRSNASCTGLGSSDEANSGEQRNNDTHRHPPMERRHRAARDRGVSRKLAAKAMSQVDSRYNGCVAFGASHARSCRAALAALTRSSRFEMSLCCVDPRGPCGQGVGPKYPTDGSQKVSAVPMDS
jgi:hypothetical protein